jgi:hypothetical protein
VSVGASEDVAEVARIGIRWLGDEDAGDRRGAARRRIEPATGVNDGSRLIGVRRATLDATEIAELVREPRGGNEHHCWQTAIVLCIIRLGS